MQHRFSRRTIVKSGLVAGALVPILGWIGTADAAALAPLDPNDATAKQLGFVADAATTTDPTHKPGTKCATCIQYQGKPTDATAGCTIFAGHSVPAGGWCKVWTARPA